MYSQLTAYLSFMFKDMGDIVYTRDVVNDIIKFPTTFRFHYHVFGYGEAEPLYGNAKASWSFMISDSMGNMSSSLNGTHSEIEFRIYKASTGQWTGKTSGKQIFIMDSWYGGYGTNLSEGEVALPYSVNLYFY